MRLKPRGYGQIESHERLVWLNVLRDVGKDPASEERDDQANSEMEPEVALARETIPQESKSRLQRARPFSRFAHLRTQPAEPRWKCSVEKSSKTFVSGRHVK